MNFSPTCITTAGWLMLGTGLFFTYIVGIIVGLLMSLPRDLEW